MFYCAQLDSLGICRTVAMLKAEVEGDNIIPIDPGHDVMGMKYHRESGRWYRLAASVDTPVAAGATVPVSVSWRAEDGDIIADPDPVTASCEGIETEVVMVDGAGEFDFTPGAPGTYKITIRSASGVETRLEVAVE